MSEKKPTYTEGIGWRYEIEHSMKRRMLDHDYLSRCIYMITMSVEGRRQLLGELAWSASDASDAHIVPSPLGREVERCWMSISTYYPEAEPLRIQLMPDHIHAILFVKREMTSHLGKIVNGFKVGCNRAYRQLLADNEAAVPGPAAAGGPVAAPCSEAVPCSEAMPQKTHINWPSPTPRSPRSPTAPTAPSIRNRECSLRRGIRTLCCRGKGS